MRFEVGSFLGVIDWEGESELGYEVEVEVYVGGKLGECND